MPQNRIVELEQQLITAQSAVAALTVANAALTEQLSDADGRARKLKRMSRNHESSLKEQLAVAQSRRG
ncbi:MAG: hypothetical protein CFE26_22500 [Verrucomicrobiales bacterium VVV1]|nr:MAG: hypothetical protein CFE26_22500 [Verrucomicrobiales bacterium VVV1]